ncbi:hypothetical protein [Sinanaerobacter chloroacetimidivorans]|uniref:Uncharacterized protein n=1 Tax=Sinanaerobacter chloroacetimidivorans TaxID=2818044 RepID=A0A8J7W273_9FIRM|nr:hypothetical protein [Sinanaerobacter chloroacetimidivorans]MBR0599031.1 hypothetical protein [Sinanaerobacter chloroacetimidivorans]
MKITISTYNYYIKNLEAAYIYRAAITEKEYSVKDIPISNLYTATFPFSLESIRAKRLAKNEFEFQADKRYTEMFINVTFKKDYKDAETGKKVKKNKIRKYIYNHGFSVDGIKYCFYKRGSNKAKNGSAIFVRRQYYDRLISKSNLGITFEKNEMIDMASIRAYEALIMSSIEFTIELKASEILIIDDIYGREFETRASITEQVENKIITETKTISRTNCLTDGQSLLDESVFEKYNKSHKAFMLLRNDWLKSCAFNTRLQSFWEAEGITEIVEKLDGKVTGRTLKCSEIKLIITPNSLKWLKLTNSKFEGDKIKCYLHWLTHIENTVGVVKCDKAGNYGSSNRATYQLINSLPLSYGEVKELAKIEIDYVMSLKNDFAIFKNYIGQNHEGLLEDDGIEDKEDSVNDEYKSNALINALLAVNSEFRKTTKFIDWKKEQINYYIDGLRRGKLRLKDTVYVTLFCNPYSMLQATIGKYEKGECSQKGREIWCSYYKEGMNLCGSRNPHVNSGNVLYLTNKYRDEYSWFNLTEHIIIINANDNDILDRAQGADMDSDQFLLLPHSTLVRMAKYCEENFPTPINLVEGKVKLRKNNNLELAKLDNMLCNNAIGKIVNKSQIINSYMWDYISKGADDGLIDAYYQASSRLSSLSQIEIDKSKKSFDNIKITKEMNLINEFQYDNKPILDFHITESGKFDKKGKPILDKKMIVPSFFKYVTKKDNHRDNNKYRAFRSEGFQCPMDFLEDILDKEIKKPHPIKDKVQFKDLLVRQKDLNGNDANSKQLDKIYAIVKKWDNKIKSLNLDSCVLNDKAKKTVRQNAKSKAISDLKNLTINSKTILMILRKAFGVTENDIGFSKHAMMTLNLLYFAYPKETLDCFRNTQTKDEFLIKTTDGLRDGIIEIFGETYIRKIVHYPEIQDQNKKKIS